MKAKKKAVPRTRKLTGRVQPRRMAPKLRKDAKPVVRDVLTPEYENGDQFLTSDGRRISSYGDRSSRSEGDQQSLFTMVHEAEAAYEARPAGTNGEVAAGTRAEARRPELMSIKEASEWASELLSKKVTPSNISYLIQYGRIGRYGTGSAMVDRQELAHYYQSYLGRREIAWKGRLGDDIDWHLSFDHLKEARPDRAALPRSCDGADRAPPIPHAAGHPDSGADCYAGLP